VIRVMADDILLGKCCVWLQTPSLIDYPSNAEWSKGTYRHDHGTTHKIFCLIGYNSYLDMLLG
jgi:hypothetical protein